MPGSPSGLLGTDIFFALGLPDKEMIAYQM
jgi:hypothetical protein